MTGKRYIIAVLSGLMLTAILQLLLVDPVFFLADKLTDTPAIEWAIASCALAGPGILLAARIAGGARNERANEKSRADEQSRP